MPSPNRSSTGQGTISHVNCERQLEDYASLERAINEHQIDTVFHLAAQPIVSAAYRSPLPTFESNIRGTYNLLESCRQLRGLVKRVVIASSDKAYGDQPNCRIQRTCRFKDSSLMRFQKAVPTSSHNPTCIPITPSDYCPLW